MWGSFKKKAIIVAKIVTAKPHNKGKYGFIANNKPDIIHDIEYSIK